MKKIVFTILLCFTASYFIAQNVQKITGSSATVLNARFGSNLAIDYPHALIISQKQSTSGSNKAGYFFKLVNGVWTENQIITNPGTAPGFGVGQTYVGAGSCIDISGDYAFIGSWDYSDGYVYVYKYDGTNWNLDQTIYSTDDYFGRALSVDGNTLVVSSEQNSHIYAFNGSSWVYDEPIAEQGGASENFGYTVKVNNNHIAITEPNDATHFNSNGAVYMYEYTSGNLSAPEKLTYFTADSVSFFGSSVDISENQMIIGAASDWGVEQKAKAFIYNFTTNWNFVDTIKPAIINTNDASFGISSAIIENNYFVGQENYNSTKGKAYMFNYSGSSWIENDHTPADITTGDYFAGRMVTDGKFLMINSPLDDDNGQNSGSVYIYDYCSTNGPAEVHDICAGDSILIDGIYYYTDTIFNQFLTNARGCDSTISHTVNVHDLPTVTASATNINICQGDQVTLTGTGNASNYTWDNSVTNGLAFTPSNTNTYTVTGTNTYCSATDQITITVNSLPIVNANSSSSILCEGNSTTLFGTGNASVYFWDNGVNNGVSFTPTATTLYTVTGTDGVCTNIDTITVIVKTVDASVIVIGNTITANNTNATYQWVDCNNGFSTISGETNQSYSPMNSGNYAVNVTENGCTKMSSCNNLIITGINESAYHSIDISPNPFSTSLNLKNLKIGSIIKLMDINGKLIYEQHTNKTNMLIDTEKIEKGLYFLQIVSGNDYQTTKVIKQ